MTTHNQDRLILASGSEIRATLLRNAGLTIEIEKPRVDEEGIRQALEHEGAPPRDVADSLAEMKARKISQKHPEAWVIGCDQVMVLGGKIYAKPETADIARAQLMDLRGKTHKLLSAAVIYRGAEPVWRHIGVVELTMEQFSDAYLDDYVARNWASIRHSVGAYKLEEEGIRLFTKVRGDYFTVLGLPLLEILSFLRQNEAIET